MNTYRNVFGIVLIVVGVAIIVFGLWHGYGIFSGKTSLPAIVGLELKTEEATSIRERTLTITNPTTGRTEIAFPIDVIRKVSRGSDVVIQYIFVVIMILGGGKIAKLGFNLISLPGVKFKAE